MVASMIRQLDSLVYRKGDRCRSDKRTTEPRPRDEAVDAVILLLAEKWPACFFVYEQRRRPLKLGIHRDILAVLEGIVTVQELRSALRCYVGNPWYLHAAMTPGAVRIDLDGNPSGAVSAEEADAAAARSASRKRNRRPVSTPVPAPPPPKRIGLADLKREAQARKARKAAAA
jgi:ProP effector